MARRVLSTVVAVMLMLGCRASPELVAPPTEPDTVVTLRVACASVWTVEVDGAQVNGEGEPMLGALWYFPAAGRYRLALASGVHQLTLIRWQPTMSAGLRLVVARGDTLDLLCRDAA